MAFWNFSKSQWVHLHDVHALVHGQKWLTFTWKYANWKSQLGCLRWILGDSRQRSTKGIFSVLCTHLSEWILRKWWARLQWTACHALIFKKHLFFWVNGWMRMSVWTAWVFLILHVKNATAYCSLLVYLGIVFQITHPWLFLKRKYLDRCSLKWNHFDTNFINHTKFYHFP